MTTANQTRDRLDVRSVRERLLAPTAPYYLLIGATSLLTVLGLVMVLSASSVTSYTGTGSSFTVFKSQAIYAGIGVILATIASFVPPRWWKRLALPIYVFAILAELLVFTSLGATINGNRNWIAFGGYTAQPSEVGKFAIVLVGALVLTAKRKRLAETKHVLIPLVFPLGLVLIGLVIAGHDLGTTMVLGAILAAVMFTAGVRARVFVMGAGAAALLLGAAVLTSGNRTSRLDSWLGTCMDAESRAGVCFQAMHGQFALADGGWWGVGLGASREKWGLLPEAHNDFIFAIIGEEPRPAGHAYCHRAVRDHRLCLLSHHRLQHRLLRPCCYRRRHGVGAHAGGHQHRLCDRAAADHRRSAAAGLLWWLGADHHVARSWHGHLVCQTRARVPGRVVAAGTLGQAHHRRLAHPEGPSLVTPPASVVLAGGGTAGHISPLLATAEEIHARWPDTRITVLGSHGGLEERIVPEAGLDLHLIDKVAFPRRPNMAAVKFPVALRGAITQTGQLLDDVAADVVVGFGGFVSPPAYLAARRRGIPTVIHEQNARPGLANRLGARYTPFVG